MQEEDWELLLGRIENGECTPIIGPAVNEGLLPTHSELAESWAAEHAYPLPDSGNLARVSQFLAVDKYELFPNDQMAKVIAAAGAPDFKAPGQPHDLLAELNLPLYITTNYDDTLYQALAQRKLQPTRAFCRWNRMLRDRHPELDSSYRPLPATPLVYHLHGHVSALESLVLREDDYLDFLVHIASQEYKLPPQITTAFGETSLLFIGYHPGDWEFRVLLRGLIKTTDPRLRRLSVSAQFPLPVDAPEASQRRAEEYLQEYFQGIDRQMRVFWGTAGAFLAEIADRRAARHTAAEESSEADDQRIDQIRLYTQMKQHCSIEDLHEMAFLLGVEKDNLAQAKNSFARDLIQYLKDRKRLPELVDVLRRERPEVQW